MEKPETTTEKEVPRSLWGFTLFILKEIKTQKKWVLLPVWVLLAAMAILILVSGGSSILPAIYIAF